ncbi:LiaF transmembrane domain-containing protein [Bacillus sp. JJ722]|uniref:LiaF transmembrane domain-containing protein n=1 Tax=Bacillus sp. JJ722 TaxID=3122973 RepID=UPI002FFDD3AE
MNSRNLFAATTLILFGIYFFLNQSKIEVFPTFYTWPTLLCIVGIAFLVQAYKANNNEAILPGIILFGFGLHFHLIQYFSIWSNEIGVFLLIISLGFLLQSRRAKTSSMPGIILMVIAILLLFNEKATDLLGTLGTGMGSILSFWPLLLVGIGIALLIMKK